MRFYEGVYEPEEKFLFLLSSSLSFNMLLLLFLCDLTDIFQDHVHCLAGDFSLSKWYRCLVNYGEQQSNDISAEMIVGDRARRVNVKHSIFHLIGRLQRKNCACWDSFSHASPTYKCLRPPTGVDKPPSRAELSLEPQAKPNFSIETLSNVCCILFLIFVEQSQAKSDLDSQE